MLTYKTYAEPAALAGKRSATPMGDYGVNHSDVMRSLSSADFDVAAARAQADYANQFQQTQQSNALSGLRQMAADQENRSSLYNTRLQNMIGAYNGLLSGLFS